MRPPFGPVGTVSVMESDSARITGGASAATTSGLELVGSGGPFWATSEGEI